MDLSDKILYVLSLCRNPSEKIGLICLIVVDKPITTAELNVMNNCHKTFDNYKVLFQEDFTSGLVKIYSQKDYRGVKRQHFCIDSDVLEDRISNN